MVTNLKRNEQQLFITFLVKLVRQVA
uniref:Uncharacterized protein n=1 Tax=Anguilla anguilla TaxID=7936 RepID=A0A0E9T5W1_ANGAN